MGPSEESRALLQLLLVRGKDFDDVASLLGTDREEVLSRLEVALSEFDASAGDLPRISLIYLTNQAGPVERADAVSLLAGDPKTLSRWSALRDSLIVAFPEADLPGGPGEAPKMTLPDASGTVVQDDRRGRLNRLPEVPNRALLALLVAGVGLAAVVGVVLLVTGGNDQSTPGPQAPTEARLRPSPGQSGSGSVEFGFSGNQFAANVDIGDLRQSEAGNGYALWLTGPVGAFPFESARVGTDGTIAGQSIINQAVICFIAADLFTEIRLSRVSDGELRSALSAATSAGGQNRFPRYSGQTVLSGPISMPKDSRDRIIEVCRGRNPAG